MAVTNTGIVLRTITGVNESDLFLDSEATSTATNTGIVERSIVGVHDANFVHPLGDELVSNGGFDADTDWLKGTGWSISGGSANYNTSSNNTLSQAGDFVDGKTYKVTLEVKSYVRGTPFVTINSGASVQVPTAVGIHTMYLVAGTSPTKAFRYYGGGFSSGGEGSIDNISVKEMLVNRESTATNTGIVERSLTGLNESVAFRQDVRTNLVTYSEDFSNAVWDNASLGTTPILETGYLAPDGTNNAFKISNANQDSFWYTIPSVIGSSTTRSIYARTTSGTGTAQLCSHNSNTNNTFTITEQWQRFDLNATASTTGQAAFYAVDFRGSGTLSEVVLWGAQAEDSLQATSYIYTNGAAVTVDSNSTSVVNNTGIVERPITGVNESDALFPDNTDSTVVNISQFIIPLLTDLEARATTFENREATINTLINLQKC